MASSSSILSFSSSHQNLHFQLNQLKGLASTATRTRKDCCNLITRSSLTNNNADLLQAAKHTVDTYIRSGMVIGLGSGHASRLAIQYLGQQLRAGKIKDIVGIPTSVGSASEAAKAGILLDQYEDSSQIDFAFNDADIVEENTLAAVIGRQSEESIIQEKTILKAAGELVFMIMGKQYRNNLDGSIPVLINPLNWIETAEEIDDLFLGDAEEQEQPRARRGRREKRAQGAHRSSSRARRGQPQQQQRAQGARAQRRSAPARMARAQRRKERRSGCRQEDF